MQQHEALLVVDSINRMFNGNYFCITKVSDLMKVTGARETKDYHALRLYHCVHFADMTREVKDTVFALTLKVVTTVDEFPAVKLVQPTENYASQIAIEAGKRTSTIGKLFG